MAPITYFQLVWAGVMGWLVFGHLPDHWGTIGMAAIALSGMAVALHTNHRRRSEFLRAVD